MPAPANGVWDGSGREKPKRIGVADLWADLNYSRELGSSMTRAVGCPYFRRAFGWCVPIGGLGGLIGLGGGEFRLPVLMYGIGFNARLLSR
jgi:hypothetical protein